MILLTPHTSFANLPITCLKIETWVTPAKWNGAFRNLSWSKNKANLENKKK